MIALLLIKLTKLLLPSGRAFRMPDYGVFRAFQEAINKSEERAYIDALSLFNIILPDNNNFTSSDATAWESSLGLINNPDTILSDRKLAIVRKMNHPGTIKTRQNWRYIENELRKAGFDVYVTENRFDDGSGGYITKNPLEIAISPISSPVQHGQVQHGQVQHGQSVIYKIANSISNVQDAYFNTGDNLRSTFYISSATLGVNAVIPASREIEFRKLVLTLKPVQTVCFAFVSISEPGPVSYITTEDDFLMLTNNDNTLINEESYA